MFHAHARAVQPGSPEALAQTLLAAGHSQARLLISPAQSRLHPDTGLLIANDAHGQPFLYLARIDEQLITSERAFELNTHFYRHAVVSDGWRLVTAVGGDSPCITRYQVAGRVIERSCRVVPGARAIELTWRLLEGPRAALTLRPLLALRSLHAVQKAHTLSCQVQHVDGWSQLTLSSPRFQTPLELFWGLRAGDSSEPLAGDAWWYYQIHYPEGPADRRLEDLFSPGHSTAYLEPDQPVVLVVSLDPGLSVPAELAPDHASHSVRPQLSSWLELDVQERLAQKAALFLLGSGPHARLSMRLPEGSASLETLAESLLGLLAVPSIRNAAPWVLESAWKEATAPSSQADASESNLERAALVSAMLLEALLVFRQEPGSRQDRASHVQTQGELEAMDAVLRRIWAFLAPRLDVCRSQLQDPLPLEGLEQAALQVGGLLAGAAICSWINDSDRAQAYAQSGLTLRQVARRLVLPEKLEPTRALALALGLPHPLFVGPLGWKLAEQLEHRLLAQDQKTHSEQSQAHASSDGDAGQVSTRRLGSADSIGWEVQALRRQLQRPLPAMTALWAPLLSQVLGPGVWEGQGPVLDADDPDIDLSEAIDSDAVRRLNAESGGSGGQVGLAAGLSAGLSVTPLASLLLALRSGRLCLQVPQR